MSKKGKSHETQAANVVADPVLPAVPAEHDEPASAALVAGDGGDAAGATGEQYAGEPPAAAGDAGSSSLGDGAGGTDAETEGQAEEDLAPAALHESDGVKPDASSDEGCTGTAEGIGEHLDPHVAVGEGDREGDMAAVVHGDSGSHADGERCGDVRSGDATPADADRDDEGGSTDVPARDPDGHHADDRDPGEHAGGEWTLDRVALCGAVGAYQETLIHGAWLAAKIRGTDPRDLETSDAVYDDMAAFVRQIGERATPDVLAQQLVIKKHRKSAEISEPERIAFGAFSSVLLGLDRHIAQERERIAREEAVAAPRPPVPIEETTMELVDAPMATWGGRG